LIGYLDTSAVVPLLVSEPTSAACRRFWDACDSVASSRLLLVEASAALAQARRLGRLQAGQHRASLRLLDRVWGELDVLEADSPTVRRASELAHRLALRGYDAVHCASAEQLADPELVAAAGDRALLAAWTRLGVASFDTTRP
jgi:predicted nucleic acid-binding protein